MRKLIIITSIVSALSCVFLFSLSISTGGGSSVIQNCKLGTGSWEIEICPCDGGTATGCKITYEFKQCDNSDGTKITGCYNAGCVKRNCTCSGDPPQGASNGFTLEWCDECSEIVMHSLSCECSGCPS